jgi:GNAT superfamily N-acetyltransferase
MHETHGAVCLRALTPREASDITVGNRPSAGWAEDFPAEGDRISCRYANFGSMSNEPWHSNWLIIVDGLASGTIGFKGEPASNQLEVGYGVVPSQRGRGVATRALAQLLALIEGRGLTIRAETAASNVASQAVLRHLSFNEVAKRCDPEFGDLLVWERDLSTAGPRPHHSQQ